MDIITFQYLNLYCLISPSVVQKKSRKPLVTVSDNEVARGENNKQSGFMVQRHLNKPQGKQTHIVGQKKNNPQTPPPQNEPNKKKSQNKTKVPRTRSRGHSQERNHFYKDQHACTQQCEVF